MKTNNAQNDSGKKQGTDVSLAKTQAASFRKRLIAEGLVSSRWLFRFQNPNGINRKITVFDIWELYKRDHLSTISESARVLTIFRCERFLPPLFEIRLCELNPQVISEFIRYSKEIQSKKTTSRRFNFEKELKHLRSMLNWYRDTIDFQFVNPVKPNHYKLSVIVDKPEKQRQISVEQLQLFLSCLTPFYHDLAVIQFFCGGRIGEAAGLHWHNVDLEKRVLKIQEVMVWIKGKPKIKLCPKNGFSREVFINDTMFEIFKRKLESRQDADLVFHNDGKALRYGTINKAFNLAWQKAGLSQFSGSHAMRYAAAQLSRRLTGSIDGAKSVTGHKSLVLAEKYSDYSSIDENKSAVEKLESALIQVKVAA